MSGTLPAVESNLKTVIMVGEAISGTLPSAMMSIKSWVDANSIGDIDVGDMVELSGRKPISGTLPTRWGELQTIEIIGLSGSSISGSLPVFVDGSPVKLIICDRCTLFSGTMPHFSKVHTTKLTQINLSDNKISGTLPPTMFTMSHLISLRAQNMSISGSIPQIQSTSECNIQSGNLANNKLSGSLPASFGDCSRVVDWQLYQNPLRGTIPSSITKISRLKSFFFFGGQLSGTIPFHFGILTWLRNLMISNVKISGSLPISFQKLTGLQVLDLSNCSLQGDLSNLLMTRKLVNLHLHYNHLSGSLPPMGPSYSMLLTHNRLSGSLPTGMFVRQCRAQQGMDCDGDDIPAVVVNNEKLLSRLSNSTTEGCCSACSEVFQCSHAIFDQEQRLCQLKYACSKATNNPNRVKLIPPGTYAGCEYCSTPAPTPNRRAGESVYPVSVTNLSYVSLSGNMLSNTIPPSICKVHTLTGFAANHQVSFLLFA